MMLFDDSRLNRLLLSSLLLIVGIILLCDGFIMIKVNVNQAENIRSSVLVILFFVGILSSVVIWDYKNARRIALSKNNRKKDGKINK